VTAGENAVSFTIPRTTCKHITHWFPVADCSCRTHSPRDETGSSQKREGNYPAFPLVILMLMTITVFCDVTPSSLVHIYQYFEGTSCLHIYGGIIIPWRLDVFLRNMCKYIICYIFITWIRNSGFLRNVRNITPFFLEYKDRKRSSATLLNIYVITIL
jgi:hypothetical protein